MINSKRIAKEFLDSNFLVSMRIKFNHLVLLKHEIFWVTFGQIVTFLGSFLGMKLLTNIMRPEGYGLLALGITIAGLLGMFIYGPIGHVVLRFFSVCREKGELSAYFFVLKRAHVVLGILLLVLISLAGILTNSWAGGKWALLVVMSLLFGVVSGVSGFFTSLQSAIRQRKVVALHQSIDAWLRPVLAIGLLYLFCNNVYFALLGYLMGSLVVVFSQYTFALNNAYIKKYWKGVIPAKNTVQDKSREFFRYASPFVLWACFSAISAYSDRWILQGFFGEKEVGFYVVLYQIANAPIALIVGVINQFILPIIFERAGAMTEISQAESSERLLFLAVIVSIIVMLPIIIITYFFSEPLIGLLTSPVFTEHHQVLWVVSLGLVLCNVGHILISKGFYCNQPRIYTWPTVIKACSFLVLAYFLVKNFGFSGVAIALCVSSLLYLIAIIIVNRRLVGVSS